ncbi:PHB depolymerase family esterase [Jannaschia sp. W003]|uniref:alpha/beta hydrolase family esterase n=1 Tax=Jannaschia sp. W003 TaxID=2867012 RepID=UPI0021A686E7|nr:alpha/beta fold hydrolase [Jannaschia sp. W003]UWQ20731.1 polyhydroxybutyrate depolymerase [Jannaschia sp. W003]
MGRIGTALVALALLAAGAAGAQGCGGADAPCEVEVGSYHLRLPDGAEGPVPVLLFFHGHNASGRMVFGAGGLERDFLEQGYAIVAPNGPARANGVRSWAGQGAQGARDVAFVLAVLDDVGARVSLGPVFAAGFSAGGSMAWLMGCAAPERIAGVAAVAGALRRPLPERCVGAVPLWHVHGFADRQVPLEGRAIGGWHQGDVGEALAIRRAANGCRSEPDVIAVDAPFRCRTWSSCGGAPVRLCLHDGGHGLPPGWTARARAFLEAATAD